MPDLLFHAVDEDEFLPTVFDWLPGRLQINLRVLLVVLDQFLLQHFREDLQKHVLIVRLPFQLLPAHTLSDVELRGFVVVEASVEGDSH